MGIGRAHRRRKNQGIACGVAFLPRRQERVEESYSIGLYARYSLESRQARSPSERLLGADDGWHAADGRAQELRIECLFPADEATETLHVALISAA